MQNALNFLIALSLGLAGCSKANLPHSHSGEDGHQHGPTSAKSIAASGQAGRKAEDRSVPQESLCAAHRVSKALCFICDAVLRDRNRLWCNEHARYEDRCWKCHPDSRDKARLYCEEHGLYEDECFLCHPELNPAAARGAASIGAPGLKCQEHGVPEAECGICHPELMKNLKAGSGVKVRLPSGQSARRAGVEMGQPSVGAIADVVECYAEIAFNQNKLAQIVAPVGGILQEVAVDLGDIVEEKQSVARLWSASIAEAVAKAVLTHQTLDREKRLRAQRVTSEQALQEAEAAHRAACQQLRTQGFTEEQIETLGTQPQDQVLLEMRAPFAGEIVERNAVRGALVELGKPLFTLSDRSVMWGMLNLPESALDRIRTDLEVELTLDAIPNRTFVGKLTWISSQVDGRTRMTHARAEIPNPNGLLKAGMFARAKVLLRGREGAFLLPSSAIQYVDGTPMVFVQLADDLFEARVVQVGASSGDRREIVAGLTGQEAVAMAHAFPLKSQLLVSRLGAGCAHEK